MGKTCGCDDHGHHEPSRGGHAPLRAWFDAKGITVISLIGAPGAGKTALLEATIENLGRHLDLAVLEGDPETSRDAERIRRAGGCAVQINTGTGCHLDALLIEEGLRHLQPEAGSVLFVENVGNLICPALFDLGERARVLVMSVTEGEDAPLKYAHVFRIADLLVLSKSDLSRHVSFDTDRFLAHLKLVNAGLEVLSVSAHDGTGIEAWCQWIEGWQELPRGHHVPCDHALA